MELTLKERLILANQYRILESVDGQNAEAWARLREVMEWGWEGSYGDAVQWMQKDEDVLPRAECRLVWEIMDVYSAMQHSHQELGSEVADVAGPTFLGFDGNTEARYMAYADFIISKLRRFDNLTLGNDLNSHFPMRDRYRAALDRYTAMGKPARLNAGQLRELDSILSSPAI